VSPTHPHVYTPPTEPANLDDIGFRILDTIEPRGRNHPLARLQNLIQWLETNYPGVKIESLPDFPLNVNFWMLIILTVDRKNGIAVLALDSHVSASVLKWFEGGIYDGRHPLVRTNIVRLAKAEYREGKWVCTEKGIVDLNVTYTPKL